MTDTPALPAARKTLTLTALTALTGGTADGPIAKLTKPDSVQLYGAKPLEDAGPHDVSFVSNEKYVARIPSSHAGVILVGEQTPAPKDKLVVRCADPYLAFTLTLIEMFGYRQPPREVGDATGSVAKSATIGTGVRIMPGAVIADDATIGDRTVIYPNVFVGPHVTVGSDCILHANVVVYDHTLIGDRVTIHANSTIGEDGLGYAPTAEGWKKIPQVGRVRIEDDVEIGANCAIDRATIGETVIGRGVKMSNHIAIGHGCKIGEGCLFVAQSGLAGSVTVGRGVMFAGQSGCVGHVTIGDGARIAAKAGVTTNVPAGETMLGQPARPIAQAKRILGAIARLPRLMSQWRGGKLSQ